MRKTLLIAAAALAASVISSQAQVYSQNIVGYVNQVIPGGGVYSLQANPLLSGTNGASQVLTSLSPSGGETLFIWTGSGFYVYSYQGAGVGTGLGYQSDWTDGSAVPPNTPAIPGDQTDNSDGVYWAPQPILKQGEGYFIENPNGTETNTFVGTAITTNSVSIPGGGVYSMLASAIPVGGNVSTNPAITLSANFSPSGGETVYLWNGSGYYVYSYQGAGVGTGLGYQSDWTDGSAVPPNPPVIPGDQTDNTDGVYWAPAPVLSLGQGFFIENPNGAENWIQSLP